jgi:predicted ATPase
VYRLDPLACAPEDPALTAAVTQTYPATQLFLERAAASGSRLNFTDAEAALVASICRKLDGVALAIELAAGRVESYGLQRTAALLDQRLTLLWPGQRTAPPRQKTLQATLDWSFELLSDLERAVLRRLAVFVGTVYAGGGAGDCHRTEHRQRAGLWCDRQSGRKIHRRGPSGRRDDALSATGCDTDLRARDARRRC